VLVFTVDGKADNGSPLVCVAHLGLASGGRRPFIKGRLAPGEAKALEIFGDALVCKSLGKASPGKPRNRRDRDRQLVQVRLAA